MSTEETSPTPAHNGPLEVPTAPIVTAAPGQAVTWTPAQTAPEAPAELLQAVQAIANAGTPPAGPPVAPTGEFDNSSELSLDEEPATESPAADAGSVPQKAFRQNFTLTDAERRPYTTQGFQNWNDELETTYMPGTAADFMMEKLAETDSNVSATTDPAVSSYVYAVGMSGITQPMDGAMLAVSRREDAEFVQDVEVNGKMLSSGAPRIKPPSSTAGFTPEASVNFFRGTMKLGTVFMLPLWHSGFWITLKAPSESDLLELNRKIAGEKVAVGRQTYGRIFSSTTSYTARHLTDFILDHLYSTSLALPEGEDLRKHILLPDLSLLAWGMACTMYPNGFQYARPCTAHALKCRHTVQEKLNLARLLWTDKSKLSEKQRLHMTKHDRHSMTLESVASYRDEFLIGKNKSVSIGAADVELTVPSLEGYLASGFRWSTYIEETYGTGMSMDTKERESYLRAQAKATAMREYAHCVKAISSTGSGVTEDRQEVIEQILNAFSALDDVRDNFITQVTRFLEDATMSHVAIPTYDCPKCGTHQQVSQEGSPYPELIPLDVTQTFFHLAFQRQKLINRRDLKLDPSA